MKYEVRADPFPPAAPASAPAVKSTAGALCFPVRSPRVFHSRRPAARPARLPTCPRLRGFEGPCGMDIWKAGRALAALPRGRARRPSLGLPPGPATGRPGALMRFLASSGRPPPTAPRSRAVRARRPVPGPGPSVRTPPRRASTPSRHPRKSRLRLDWRGCRRVPPGRAFVKGLTRSGRRAGRQTTVATRVKD